MTKNIALSRPAMSAIAAFLTLSTPAAFAQDVPTVTMTPPVAPTTVPAPAPAPTTITPPAAETPAPQPVIRVPLDLAPAEPAPKAAAPKEAAPAQPKRAAAKPRAAAPAAPHEAAAPVIPTAAPAVEEVAPVVTPVAAPVEPIAEAAPAPQPVERATTNDSNLPWEIAGGAAALLLIGGAGLAFARRRRASNEVWEFDEAPADAEWVPGATAVATEPEPVVAPQTTPTFAAAPSGSMGRHEAMAMAGPTPDNPFATLQKRLARARFLDRQERAEYDATLAAQKDMRRTPVSAWEISQRAEPAAPAEQEVRRLEPGRARKELKPGWTRN
jgi:LPXTG-motif cell wall-anchored protein